MKSIITIIFLFCNAVSASSLDQAKAEDLAKKGKILDAMKIYAKCLKANSPKDFEDLENCLYKGEFYTNKLIEKLVKENSNDNPASLDPYNKLGIKLRWGHYGEIEYDNDFFRKLKNFFPKSKYREEVEYALITHKISGVDGWKEYEKSLNDFISQFPNGKYAVKAKLRLALVYDNLWDLIRPSENEYHKYFSTGNKEKDIESSDSYREKSLKLYSEVTNQINSPFLSKEEVSVTKQRAIDLEARKAGTVFSILND